MTDMTFTDDSIEMSSAQIKVGGTDFGGIMGSAVFNYEVGMTPVRVDQSSMIRKHFLTQEGATLEFTCAEWDYDVLQRAFPTGTYVLDSGSVTKKISVGGGSIVAADYKELIVTPVIGGAGTLDTDGNLIITIFKAICINTQTITFGKEEVRGTTMTFEAKADSSLTAGAQLFLLGTATASA